MVRISLTLVVLLFTTLGYSQKKTSTVEHFEDGGGVKRLLTTVELSSYEYMEHETIYYKSGKVMEESTSLIRKPNDGSSASTTTKKPKVVKRRVYSDYYENGKVKEKGKLHHGSGTVKIYNEEGKLTRIKKMKHYNVVKEIKK